jgi:hypothetical protein
LWLVLWLTLWTCEWLTLVLEAAIAGEATRAATGRTKASTANRRLRREVTGLLREEGVNHLFIVVARKSP